MRVAFVSWRDLAHPQAGGSELVVDRLAAGLAGRGHEVALLCGGPLAHHDYEAVDLGGTYGQYLRAPIAARRFRGWDVIVDVENGIPFFSPLWRRGASVCLVHHVHTRQWAMRFPEPVAAFGRFLEARAMPRVYRNRLFAAVSPSTAEALQALGVPQSRIRMVRCGIEHPVQAGVAVRQTAEPQFLALGRLVPHKQIDRLLRVWRAVQPLVGGRLVIAGDGPDRQALEAMRTPQTHFVGRVTDGERDRLLAESWFLVHAAVHEGWGVVVMEAAASGRPTVAFDAPGIHDAVVHGVTGLLAADEEEMCRAWTAVARDAELRARLGEAARVRAREFTWERSVDDLLAVAEEAAGIGRASPTGVREERAA